MSGLFDEVDPPRATIVPRDPKVGPAAWPRLTRQSNDILDMLRRGRQTNASLAGVTSRYGARIFDIRRWFEKTGQTGLEIRIVQQNARTGLVTYALFRDGKEVGTNTAN